MGKKMVPNEPLNGNTVGGSASFKALPGHIVLPDRRRRMEFAGGCQKVSSLCERTGPLFTALYRTQVLPPSFVLLPLCPPPSCTASFFFSLCCSGSAPNVPLSTHTTHSKVSDWGAALPLSHPPKWGSKGEVGTPCLTALIHQPCQKRENL